MEVAIFRSFCLALLLIHSAYSLPVLAQPSLRSEKTSAPLRVLFIGNSYTYENNLPFVFEALADPIRDVVVTMLASGGASLRRNINAGSVLETIRQGHFDVVVAQEQSVLGRLQIVDGIPLIGEPSQYHQAVREIAQAAQVGGARLVLYSTWPRSETPKSIAALHNASVQIARDVRATVAPVGLVWDRLGGDASESLHLYAADGSHPSADGTYVAAVVLVRAVLGAVPQLAPVRQVPLMDGGAKPNGSFTDIVLTETGRTAISEAVTDAYEGSPPAYLAELPAVERPGEPTLPSEGLRGRLTPRFLRGEWTGAFATFGPDYRATLSLDLRDASASISLIHPENGWPGDDTVTAVPYAVDDNGVLSLNYQSKEKNCRVEVKLVRFGNALRGIVRFTPDSGQPWVTSPLTLERNRAR